jgi:hypothetical protein
MRDQASIARGSDVYNLPGGVNGEGQLKSHRPRTNERSAATRREDFRERGKASEAGE